MAIGLELRFHNKWHFYLKIVLAENLESLDYKQATS